MFTKNTGHGLFTHVLLRGLQGTADKPGHGNQQIEVLELIDYVRGEVPRLSMEKFHYEQFPVLYPPQQDFPISLISPDPSLSR